MIIKCYEVGPIAACCYVVVDENTGDAMIIDPGGDADFIVKKIEELDARPIYLVNTHGHVDHMMANAEIKEAFPDIRICIHPEDAEMLTEPGKNLSSLLGEEITSPEPDMLLNDGDEVALGGNAFKIIHLPGHSRGSICLYCEKPDGNEPGIIFSGDTLFAGGIGRTDFPDPDFTEQDMFKMLTDGIREKILSLPEDTIVYPGHGPATTAGKEKRNNPFLKGSGLLWLP